MKNSESREQIHKTSVSKLINALILGMRPIHWIKNLSLFASIFLIGEIFNPIELTNVIWGFVAFCMASSATYLINDILDLKNDRVHPTKKLRPIASGDLPVHIALLEAVFLSFSAIVLTIISPLNTLFLFLIIAYLVIQFFYSVLLKNIPIVDILIIATGFVLRVYAGAVAVDAHLSVWFLLCVISVSLFLASGKRRAELNLVENENLLTRKSLKSYKPELLNSYVTMFGNASWMSWALFTFFESPKASLPFWLVLAELSRATTIDKLLMLTIPVTIFGIMRYESLIFDGKSETPEKLFLNDKSLVIAILLWTMLVYWVLYSGVTVVGV